MPQRWRTRTETAWVLHRKAFGEADVLLEMYGQHLGRFRALAPAGRKPGSRKAGHLDLFGEVRVQLAQGRNWWVLTQAEVQTWHPRLRTDPQAFLAAGQVAEMVLRLVPEGERVPGLYPLLAWAFGRIASEEGEGVRWAPRVAAWHLMRLAGFGPQWARCVRCRTPLTPGRPKFLDVREGGLRCADCGSPPLPRVSDRAWAVLLAWSRKPLHEALNPPPAPDLYPELEALERAYVTFWLERPLQTWRVNRQMRREP